VAGNPGRDDKKERVVARKRRLLNRGIFQIGLQPSLPDSAWKWSSKHAL
jgi:hypothetical protein